VLTGIAQTWRTERADLLKSARTLAEAMGQTFRTGIEQTLTRDVLRKASDALAGYFDTAHGGFGHAPKFPQPTMLMLLLNHWHRAGEQMALDMVTKTLDAMARGGIRDHLGGGFHRYSTDAQWLVPHFEKMLYDQALLSRTYLQAHQVTADPTYAAVTRELFDYVLRDMMHEDGGFYAAEDADSEGREGAFYVWRREEIEDLLGGPDAEIFCDYYGVTRTGNFEQGENILHAAASIEDLSRKLGRDAEEIGATLLGARHRLFEHRNSRPRPHRDDKIIVSWNGLMISSLAYGGAVLGEPRYVQAAQQAAEFTLGSLYVNGRLMHYHRAGHVVEKAFLDDYAFLILGLIDLYEVSLDLRWLRHARSLAEQMIDLFAGEGEGGFFMTARDAERLLTRDKPAYDGALPSGNSVAALVLLKLGTILMVDRLTEQAEKVLRWFSAQIAESPTSFTAMLLALDYRLGPTQEIVIAGAASDAQPLIEEFRRHFLPNATLLFRETGPQGGALTDLVPFTEDLTPINDRATVYLCGNYACLRPITTAEDLAEALTARSQSR